MSDIKGNRYHPLMLNAALLGGLSEEDRRVLGFGDTRHHRPLYRRPATFPNLDRLYRAALQTGLRISDLSTRVTARAKRLLGK